MERSVLRRGGNGGATPSYGTPGGAGSGVPRYPGLAAALRRPPRLCLPGGFRKRSRRGCGGAWARGGERVWAVGRGCLGVVSPQLLICRVWLLRRQALLTSRGTASSAADRRSPGECRAGAGPRAGGAQPSAAQRPGSAGPHRILREACRRGTRARREILAGGFGFYF